MGMLNWRAGISGLGAALSNVGQKGVDSVFEQRKIELADALAGARQDKQNVFTSGEAEKERGFRKGEAAEERGFRKEEAAEGRTFQKELQAAGFDHTEALDKSRREFDTAQHEATRGLTREQMAQQERLANAARGQAERLAKLGGTIHTDPKTGEVSMIGKDGVVTPIVVNGKPLTGATKLGPTQEAYLDLLKAEMEGLVKQESSALVMGNPVAEEKIAKQKKLLYGEVLRVMAVGGAKTAPAGERPPLSSFGGKATPPAAAATPTRIRVPEFRGYEVPTDLSKLPTKGLLFR